MQIDINSRLIALIGTPLGQSLAARMQNAAYQAAGFNMVYCYCEAGSEHLKEIINGIRYMPTFLGCAVTKPNKEEVMQYLDDYDPLCKKIGSSNTVVKTEAGKLVGYNTDGYGALRDLKEHNAPIKGHVMFSFGAGGTGRSVCLELAEEGAKKIYISSRSEKCETLSEEINKFYPGVCVPVRAADEAGVKKALDETDVILNLSGLGMKGKEEYTCVDKSLIKPSHVCFDATYNPAETRFLKEAKEVGATTINGLGMSLYQGLRQIQLWTGGKAVPLDVMRETLMTILAEKAAAEKK
ncbi:MAG: shikimate dehydrogenase [Synergistaceae bacterium]|nr:shikimate dehydrogenase [Synergistaceae bacterium]